jgi:quercetin dioxygenase-like cupin family protein
VAADRIEEPHMTTIATGRPALFLLSALTALTLALMGTRPLVPASGLNDILDWTICWASAATSDRPGTKPTVVGSEPLAADPHKRITSMIVDFPPNAFSPEHHHEADLYVYVLQGTIRSQLGGQPALTYNAGQSFFEPDGTTHVFAENTSLTEPARILAVFVHREDARLIVFH